MSGEHTSPNPEQQQYETTRDKLYEIYGVKNGYQTTYPRSLPQLLFNEFL